MTPRIPSPPSRSAHPGSGTVHSGASTSSTHSGCCSRNASAATSGALQRHDRETGARASSSMPVQRQRDQRGAGAVDLVHADGAKSPSRRVEMRDGRGADLGRRRRGGQLGGGALQHGQPGRRRALVGEQQRVVQRQRGAPRDLLHQHAVVVVVARRVAVAQQGQHAEHPTACGQRDQQRGPHRDPAVQRDPVRPAAPRATPRSPTAGTSGSRRERPVVTTSCTVGDSRSIRGQGGLHVRVDAPRSPSRCSRPSASRRSTQHRSASRVSITSRASRPIRPAGSDSALQPGAEPREQGLPLGLPVARVDVGAAADPSRRWARSGRRARASTGTRRPPGGGGTRPPSPRGPRWPPRPPPGTAAGPAGAARRAIPRRARRRNVSGELLPAPVHEHPRARRVRHPDQRRGEVGHGGEPRLGLAACAPELQVRTDAREQLLGRERLDEVVVRARGQALDRRLLPGAGREQQHGDAGGARSRRAARRGAPSRRARASSRR